MKKLIPILMLLSLASCAVNPVTGERNLQFYGSDWENEVGTQMYAPMKQSQGGEFVLDPALEAYVDGVGQRLAQNARRKNELDFQFSIINSSVPNAWALPGGKIAINRGLLTQLRSEAELAAVLGHEIVHADAAHSARAQSKGVLTQIGTVAGMIIVGTTIDNPVSRDIGMLVPQLGAQLLTTKYGRDAERESDEYGMLYMAEAGYNPEGAIGLQQTFVQLSEGRNQDWLSGLFASHPPSRERVENNRQTAERLAAEGFSGGDVGKQSWQEATAYLKRVQPAYDHYDKAYQSATEQDWETAQKNIDAAMKIEPRESLFHALQGDIHMAGDYRRKAMNSYDRAVTANSGLFYGWMRRGQTRYELDDKSGAREDLEHSLTLLPTAQAHYTLGKLDMEENRRVSAMDHFRVAAQSGSELGVAAEREILLLDLPERAASYVEIRPAANNSGELYVQVGNRTRSPLGNIEYRYAWIDDSGRTQQGSGAFSGVIEGGKWAQTPLRVRINSPADLNQRVRVEVTGATLVE